jgi:hypothetical protein
MRTRSGRRRARRMTVACDGWYLRRAIACASLWFACVVTSRSSHCAESKKLLFEEIVLRVTKQKGR